MSVLEKTGDLVVEVAGEELRLTPERAVYWSRRATLFVADLHIGKEATFRAAGIPLPAGGTADVLRRLSLAIRRTSAERVIVLGDFFHAEAGRNRSTMNQLAAWRDELSEISLTVVAGNHDRRTRARSGELGIRILETAAVDEPFVLCHEPTASEEGYVLAGHLHPAALLTSGRTDSVRLPCFVFGERVGILPAFSRFTGRNVYLPVPAERVYVVADGEVLPVR